MDTITYKEKWETTNTIAYVKVQTTINELDIRCNMAIYSRLLLIFLDILVGLKSNISTISLGLYS